MEQGTGVEPASEAWEATIIADILTLRGLYYSRGAWKIQPLFVDKKAPADFSAGALVYAIRYRPASAARAPWLPSPGP